MMLPSPTRLFLFAQAFYFSSGRGQCFSPGIKALFTWYVLRLKDSALLRHRWKRLRVLWEAH